MRDEVRRRINGTLGLAALASAVGGKSAAAATTVSTTTATAGVVIKISIVAVLVGVGVTGVVALKSHPESNERRQAGHADTAALVAVQPAAPEQRPPDPVVASAPVVVPVPEVAAPRSVAAPTPSQPEARTNLPAENAPEPRSEVPPTRDVPNSAETELLTAAATALNSGDSAAALSYIATDRAHEPAGALAEERDALEIQAFAKAERWVDLRTASEAFFVRYPRSLHTSSIQSLASAARAHSRGGPPKEVP
jgi:hypothetical protein